MELKYQDVSNQRPEFYRGVGGGGRKEINKFKYFRLK